MCAMAASVCPSRWCADIGNFCGVVRSFTSQHTVLGQQPRMHFIAAHPGIVGFEGSGAL